MDDNVILRALMGAAGASVLAEIDLEKKRQEAEDLRKDRDHWRQARQDAHEAGELMRAEIETLRQQLADAQRAVSDAFAEVNSVRQQLASAQRELSEQSMVANVQTQQDAAAWQQQVDSANAEVRYLRARLDEERSVTTGLREQLDAAHQTILMQRAGIERLQAFVGNVRAARDEHNGLDRDARLEAALAELDAGAEPTPVAEPLEQAENGA